MRHRPLPPLVAVLALAACGIDKKETQRAIELIQQEAATPDTLPVMRNPTLPFRYPHELYERKVQGQVTLRIFIDQYGMIAAESTRVVTSSGYAGFDSAAVKGAEEL